MAADFLKQGLFIPLSIFLVCILYFPGLLSRAAECLESAIESFGKFERNSDGKILCIYKLLGDAYSMYYYLPSSLANPEVRNKINFEDINLEWNADNSSKLKLLENGMLNFHLIINGKC